MYTHLITPPIARPRSTKRLKGKQITYEAWIAQGNYGAFMEISPIMYEA